MLCCEVLECCPWFEFADLDLGASDGDFDTSSSISYEIAESDADSDGGIEEAFCGLLGRAGVSLKPGQGAGPLHAGCGCVSQVLLSGLVWVLAGLLSRTCV